jgi:hypothetical protein
VIKNLNFLLTYLRDMTAGKSLLALAILLCVAFSTEAQKKTKAQLQKERQQNLQKIKEVEKILSETTAKKKNSLGELTKTTHSRARESHRFYKKRDRLFRK